MYEQEAEPQNLNQDSVLAIDIGLENLATCVTTLGTSFIMDGRKLKAINQGWNKRRAYLQSILAKQNKRTSEQIQRATTKRNNRINDYLKKTESYTSKASFLDLDEIPIYNGDNPYTGEFSGKRITRELYRTSDNRVVNADVNGAANILRKSKQNFDFEKLCRGVLTTPSRIRVA